MSSESKEACADAKSVFLVKAEHEWICG